MCCGTGLQCCTVGGACIRKENACMLGGEPPLRVLAQTFDLIIRLLFALLPPLSRLCVHVKSSVLLPPFENLILPLHLASRAYFKGWTLEGSNATFSWMVKPDWRRRERIQKKKEERKKGPPHPHRQAAAAGVWWCGHVASSSILELLFFFFTKKPLLVFFPKQVKKGNVKKKKILVTSGIQNGGDWEEKKNM